MKNLIGIMLMCCVFMTSAQTIINHTATKRNTIGHLTTIDNAVTNGKADVILMVTQKFGVYNANEIGVWYNAGKWIIYNQNKKAIPANALFNVMVLPKNTGKAFVHTVSTSNTSNHMTTLSSKLTDGKPNALVFVTQNFGKYNTSNVGVWYSAGKWKIYNENTKMRMPTGTKFNVLVLNKGANKIGNLAMNAFAYKNTSNGHVSAIKGPSSVAKSSILFTTSNYGGVYNPNVTGVWLNGSNWSVFNQNRRPLPKNTRINVLTLPATVSLAGGGLRPKPAPKALPKIYKKSLKLPGFSRAQNISYVLERNKAVFQGDIIIGDSRKIGYDKPEPHPVKMDFSIYKTKNGVGSSTSGSVSQDFDMDKRSWRWHNGIIPYLIDNNLNSREKQIILDGIKELNDKTNLNIVPYSGIGNHVIFYKDNDLPFNGGRSALGRQKGSQFISLKGFGMRTVIHEILHAAGFWHEQSRSDRDKFVRIIEENIQDGRSHNFKKLTTDETILTAYDKNSIMHYGGFAFSKGDSNPQPTILDLATNQPITRRTSLSKSDIKGVNLIYPENFRNQITLPISTTRQITVDVTEVSSKDWDGNIGGKKDIDFYLRCELGAKWEWEPENSSNRTKTYESDEVERYGNKISPNWKFKNEIGAYERYAKIWLKLFDADLGSDEVIDINPFSNNKSFQLFVDTGNGRIYLGDENGRQDTVNYLGQVGEELVLEGYEGTIQDIKAKITFKVQID